MFPREGRAVLEELTIQNYALIDRLTIRFSRGMNVLSGETGAGKSILVGALGLLRGVKADTSSIRTGTEEAVVSGVFDISSNQPAREWLEGRGIADEDGSVVVRRTVKTQGRSPIYLQSSPVTRSDLEEFGTMLFDIHGQHAHQSLMVEENHRRFLDQFAGIEDEVTGFARHFSEIAALRRRYEKLLTSERERLRQADLLRFSVDEIRAAHLTPGEEEELEKERTILSQHEKLYGLIEELYASLSENQRGALTELRHARTLVDQVTAIDEELSGLSTRLADAFYEVEDITETIGDYRQRMSFSPERLEEVEERLALIRKLEKKYGNTLSEVLQYCDEAEQELADLENYEHDKETLAAQIETGQSEILAEARTISEKRKKAAAHLEKTIVASVQKLGMPKTRFSVSVERRSNSDGQPACGPHGIDQIRFRLAANPGEPLKPLRSIASGGEISRVMLALKSAFAESDHVPTLIFDEIDAGIGGEVAVQVGEYLYSLSRFKQILCITHLATIAVRADNHIRVEKSVRGDRTSTEVSPVRDDDRVEEIARMLSGDAAVSVSRRHAEEMLRKSEEGNGQDLG